MTKEIVVTASIEARMGSTRLPKKVLMDINGKPALTRVLERLRKSKIVNEIILATTTNVQDDVLVDWAVSENLQYYRGSEDDVVDRVYRSHEKIKSDIVVEICGDMVLIDYDLIDRAVEAYISNNHDIVTTTFSPSFPVGIDAIVFSYALLKNLNSKKLTLEQREHLTKYFSDNKVNYKIFNLIAPKNLRFPELRLILDYASDLDNLREIYANLEISKGPYFLTEDIINFLKKTGSDE